MVLDRRADRVALALVAGATLVGLAAFSRLPARVAVHFSPSGTPDNYVHGAVAVVLLPAIAVATVAVVRGAERVDPPADPRSMDVLVVGVAVLFAAVHLFVLGYNLGYAVPMSLVVAGAVLWTMALAGYVVFRESTA